MKRRLQIHLKKLAKASLEVIYRTMFTSTRKNTFIMQCFNIYMAQKNSKT